MCSSSSGIRRGSCPTSCKEAEWLGCWVGLTPWGAASVVVQEGRRVRSRTGQREPGGSLEAGMGHQLVRGNPEKTGRNKMSLLRTRQI